MMPALQTLIDNGLSESALDSVLEDLVKNDDFSDDDERRCCVALSWYYENEGRCNPDECTAELGETVSVDGNEYRVLTNDEASAAYQDYVKEMLWAFNASFLSSETGIDQSVFELLVNKCEDSNDAIRSIIDGSCGFEVFIEAAEAADGRGPGLASYDGEEQECGDYYLYRVN